MIKINKFFGKSKSLPVDEFINNTLYDKKYGYYTSNNPFGKKGDFVTAPTISFLFSEMIAIWILDFWEKLEKPKKFNIVELGPGDGQLSAVLLKTFKKFPEFLKCTNIYLYEKSKKLKNLQKNNIQSNQVFWLSNLNKIRKGPTIFFGNEFFDAIPIKQYIKKNGTIYEKFFQLQSDLTVKTIFVENSNKDNKIIESYKKLDNRKIFEFPKMGFEQLKKIIKIVKKSSGGILLIDYGYFKQLNKNTLQSVFKHKNNNLLDNIGNADITSLVNFQLLTNFFKKNNLDVSKTVSQSFFLKKIGILNRAEIISKKLNFKDKSNLFYRLERLLNPKLMGELFKVIFAHNTKLKNIIGFK